ncbi:hypothetical protein [Wolbachia endosymbiont (group A) of Myopa testacea]|uniref:hypothetical protein n=1 Tax=Wolbachia endosymbiont (group A) of Myopa testacea TaxID=3066148 RepID=UPI00333F933C
MKEAIEALHQRIKDLAASSTPDQLVYLAKSLELIADKKVISNVNVVQMTKVKEIIDALQKRLKDLAANSTPDQLAYLAKSLELIVDKSAVSDIVQMTDGKLKELLNAARSHVNEINSNKKDSISAITEAKTESVNEINTLRTNSLNTLKASSDSHISQLDTRKNANIAAINSVGSDHKDGLKGLVDNFRAVNDVPGGSSIMKEIKTREDQLTTKFNSINDVPSGSSIMKEIKTRDEQLKASTINEVKTQNEQLKSTFEIISDPEILSRTINENDLETWLDDSDNQEKFKRMLSNASAVLNITKQSELNLLGISLELDKLIDSPKAVKLLLESNFALEIMANTLVTNMLRDSRGSTSVINVVLNALADQKVVSIITASLPAMERIMTSLPAMEMIAKHEFITSSIAKSKTAINAIISNNVVLNRTIKSELICKAIEASIQNRRYAIVESLEYSSWLFKKQSEVRVGDGGTSKESEANSATIYIPTSCYDNGDTNFSVNSLLTGNQLVHIARHRGTSKIYSGIALRGVQVSGEGGSSGYVTFDVYTAV